MSSPHSGAMGSEDRCVDPCCWCNNPWVKDPNKYGATVHSVPRLPKCDCWLHLNQVCDICQGMKPDDRDIQYAQTPERPKCECHDCTQARLMKGETLATLAFEMDLAVKLERERCAKIARGLMTKGGQPQSSVERAKGWNDACERIELGIKNGWKP